MDSGTEFKNDDINNYFSSLGIHIRYALTNRHRQASYVEYKNKIIGLNLLKIQGVKELETGKISKTWVKNLAPLIDLINDNLPEPKKPPSIKDDGPKITKENKDLIPINSNVRVKLDYPIDIATNKRLHGNFRKSDIRWEQTINHVDGLQIKPKEPPLYSVTKHDGTLYTKQQLNEVK